MDSADASFINEEGKRMWDCNYWRNYELTLSILTIRWWYHGFLEHEGCWKLNKIKFKIDAKIE